MESRRITSKSDFIEQEKEFFDLRDEIMDKAKAKGVTMRTLGAIAFRSHCPHFKHIAYSEGRKLSDIDFIARLKDYEKIMEVFTDLGWKEDKFIKKMSITRGRRTVFYGPKIHSDIFFDKLEMCHTIDLTKRLEVDYPTISLADLLLEKMQIIRLDRKDIIDTFMLLREHQAGIGDDETINVEYIASLCAKDWSIWKTITTNLEKLKHFLPSTKVFREEDRRNIKTKINSLLTAIRKKSKSLKWKMRAIIGEKKKWYRDVEEVRR